MPTQDPRVDRYTPGRADKRAARYEQIDAAFAARGLTLDPDDALTRLAQTALHGLLTGPSGLAEELNFVSGLTDCADSDPARHEMESNNLLFHTGRAARTALLLAEDVQAEVKDRAIRDHDAAAAAEREAAGRVTRLAYARDEEPLND